jgi:hypothetical protein
MQLGQTSGSGSQPCAAATTSRRACACALGQKSGADTAQLTIFGGRRMSTALIGIKTLRFASTREVGECPVNFYTIAPRGLAD